ncbi:hypothetical protein PAXRUDRAFT_824114 [Paxillus rubicundulus Ve08.2h10]|uniref:Unplaced genomic scaffold scaffold_80, whole genome shotgun sequence n=1 Tax=Paxillus rubicundulus Ve08.2h10 TaxID=930991 RepID=A0A0D0EBU0_9AGAM|nr:hypothetical protein PAXRUDRAFT_824114 [Paxillus rubicundulus Ve08.2h10]
MLAASASVTPRPRPPARSRRTSSYVKSSPPPPYRAAPVDPLAQNVHARISAESLRGEWTHLSLSAQSDQWNEQSREELSDLLHMADEIIKDREHELNVTTAACKTLYENNLELKDRHKALLARLPPSPASSSPLSSSASSPTSPGSQLPQSPHYYTADVSRTSSHASLRAPRLRQHYRRVSVSPADLALLSDQNAELLAKLERLEAESTQADQSGRRKLRTLEKEIQGLRDELEKTRARSDELEEKARVVSGITAQRDEEVERKKREREERFRALRGKTESEAKETEVRDFAPGGALSTQGNPLGLGHPSKIRFPPRRRHISEAVLLPPRSGDDAVPERLRRVSLQTGLSRSASQPNHFRFPDPVQSPISSTHEYALVSQLLLKIQELEETNAQITEQQGRTATQLEAVQKDATSLRLAYESLGDGEGVEWIAEDDEGSPKAGDEEEDETIRFASLRRSLSAEPSIDFAGGIGADMQSSLRQAVVPDHVPVIAHPRARRSVVGLFDSPRGRMDSSSLSASENTPSVLELMIPGLPPVPFVPQPSNSATTSSASRSPSPSPILSPTLAGAISPPLEDALSRPTLDSELGAAFDGKWDNGEGQDDHLENFHFRTPSLIGLTSIFPGTEDVGSTRSISSTHTQSAISPAHSQVQRSTDAFTSALSISRGSTRLHPGAWQGDQSTGLWSPPDSKSETPAEKKRRKSQTIRMRTAHWNEGRFGGTLLPSEKHDSADIARPSTPVPERLATAFEAIVDTISRSKSDTDLSFARDGRSGSAESSPVVIHSRSNTEHPRQRGIVAFVLEIWLWLQFAIIVIVFVWAMAKRGPKSVLEEAGRRKIGTSRGAGQ